MDNKTELWISFFKIKTVINDYKLLVIVVYLELPLLFINMMAGVLKLILFIAIRIEKQSELILEIKK